MDADYDNIVNSLSRLIRQELNQCDNESSRPGKGPDQSDYFIKITRAKANELRSIRVRFENVMTTSDTEAP